MSQNDPNDEAAKLRQPDDQKKETGETPAKDLAARKKETKSSANPAEEKKKTKSDLSKAKAKEKQQMPKTVILAVDKVEMLNDNVRQKISQSHVDDLMVNIKKLPPPKVAWNPQKPDIHNKVIDGWHTILAHKKLWEEKNKNGVCKIPCEYIKVKNKDEGYQISIELNCKHGKQLNYDEKRAAAKIMWESYKNQEKLAEMLGVAQATISRWINPPDNENNKKPAKENKKNEDDIQMYKNPESCLTILKSIKSGLEGSIIPAELLNLLGYIAGKFHEIINQAKNTDPVDPPPANPTNPELPEEPIVPTPEKTNDKNSSENPENGNESCDDDEDNDDEELDDKKEVILTATSVNPTVTDSSLPA